MLRHAFSGLLLALLLAGCATVSNTESQVSSLTLGPIFTDNMVLQRDAPVSIWGRSEPNAAVRISIAGSKTKVIAGPDGRWEAVLPPMTVGGPHVLTVESRRNRAVLENVVLGDVWICSGQSNMAWPVKSGQMGVDNAEAEVAAANWPSIRLLSIAREGAATPRTEINSEGWRVCTPETVGAFSAVGYFFGRDLHASVGVPIGLIDSSYGGSMIEAWMSDAGLRAVPEFAAVVDTLKQEPERIAKIEAAHAAAFEPWLASLNAVDAGYANGVAQWIAPEFDASGWRTMSLPSYWEDSGFPQFDGVIWFRHTVDVPADLARLPLRIRLGSVNDRLQLWINGKPVVRWAHNAQAEAGFNIPDGVVRAGENVIVARVYDMGGSGGLFGRADGFWLKPQDALQAGIVPLAGEWMCKEGASIQGFAKMPAPPQWHPDSPNGTSRLYNAMLAPLTRFPVRGAIWYQGEANAKRAEQYRVALPALIADWRNAWGQPELPFLIVQLANYRERRAEPHEDPWAEIRESQFLALRIPHTGLATAIDIGNADDIHPTNKQEVGRRLALAARRVTYGDPVLHSGPVATDWTFENGSARVQFIHAGSGLVAKGDTLKSFALAGSDRVFHWAEARIEGDSVVLRSEAVKEPVAARYAWAANPECTLYNVEGLPALPFRTDDWPLTTHGIGLEAPAK